MYISVCGAALGSRIKGTAGATLFGSWAVTTANDARQRKSSLNFLIGPWSGSEGEGEEEEEGDDKGDWQGKIKCCASSAAVKSSAHQILNRPKQTWSID